MPIRRSVRLHAFKDRDSILQRADIRTDLQRPIGLNQAVTPAPILEFSGKHVVAEDAAKNECREVDFVRPGVHHFFNAN